MNRQVNLGPAFTLDTDHEASRQRRAHNALQVAIAVPSIAALLLISIPSEYARWGFVVGILAQPFWMAATWRARQHGMFVVACCYAGAWALGIYARFF
jgi:hypothetical protein